MVNEYNKLFKGNNNLVEQVQENTVLFNAFFKDESYSNVSELPNDRESGSTAIVLNSYANNKAYYDLYKYSADAKQWIKVVEKIFYINTHTGANSVVIPEYATTKEWNERPNKQVGDLAWIIGATPDENIMLLETSDAVKEFKDWNDVKQYVNSQILLIGQTIHIVEDDLDKLTDKVDKNITDINTLKSNGIAIPHLEISAPLSDSEIDTKLKVLIPAPQDAEIAYVGSNGDWTLWEYDLSNTKWVKSTVRSQHSTSAPDNTKANIALDNITGWVPKVQYEWFKGQIFLFNEIKTGTYFEDATLFKKRIMIDGDAILGGSDVTETLGSVGELPIKQNITLNGRGTADGGNYSMVSHDLTTTGESSTTATGGDDGSRMGTKIGSSGPNINLGKSNLSAGVKVVRVIYIALYDKTYTTLVEEPISTGGFG